MAIRVEASIRCSLKVRAGGLILVHSFCLNYKCESLKPERVFDSCTQLYQ